MIYITCIILIIYTTVCKGSLVFSNINTNETIEVTSYNALPWSLFHNLNTTKQMRLIYLKNIEIENDGTFDPCDVTTYHSEMMIKSILNPSTTQEEEEQWINKGIASVPT